MKVEVHFLIYIVSVNYVDPEIIPRGPCGRQSSAFLPSNSTVAYLRLIMEIMCSIPYCVFWVISRRLSF